MNRSKDFRVLSVPFAVGVVVLCLGFAVAMYSIWTTADYHFIGFVLMAIGAFLVGRGLATRLRQRAE
jgi:hypothetical protein